MVTKRAKVITTSVKLRPRKARRPKARVAVKVVERRLRPNRAKAPHNRAQNRPRNVRRRTRRGARIPMNAYEPSLRPNNPKAGTYARKMLDLPSHLEPSCRFALSCMNPASIATPYVENGAVLDLPTQSLAGQYTALAGVPPADVSNYSLVICSVASNLVNGTAPVNHLYTNTSTTTYNSGNFTTGQAFTTTFGNTPYADKVCIFAAEVNIEIITAAAQLQGVVHVGSIPISATVPGVTLAQLKTRATHRIDLKADTGRVINLRTAIQNEAAIHTLAAGSSVNVCADEIAMYAIYENVAVGLTTGTPLPYSLLLNVASQAVYWPAGTVPAMNGVARGQLKAESEITSGNLALAEKQALMKDISVENAQLLRKLNHLPLVPTNMKTMVDICLQGKSLQMVFNEIMLNTAPSIAAITGGKSLESPVVLAPQMEDDIYNIDWSMNQAQKNYHFDFWSPEALSIFDEIEDRQAALLDILRQEVNERKNFQNRLDRATQEIHWEHGIRTMRYWEGESMIDIDAALSAWERDSVSEFEMKNELPHVDMRKPSPTPSRFKGK